MWRRLLVVGAAACGGGHAGVDAALAPPDAGTIVGADPGFGSGGLVTVNLGVGDSGLTYVAQQGSDALVAAGTTEEALVVMRTSLTGQLDPTFADGGVFQLVVGASVYEVTGLAVEPDGKILVAATVTPYGHNEAVVVQLTADGVLDRGFGSDGLAIDANTIQAMALAADGKIVVGEFDGSGFDLLRLDGDGTPDASFGSVGRVPAPQAISALALDSSGRIVTAGDKAIARYRSNGEVDTSFGSAGVLVASTGAMGLTEMAIGADGKILASGWLQTGVLPPPDQRLAVVRATSSGVLDATFGKDGVVADSGQSPIEIATGVAPTGSGGVIVTGYASFSGHTLTCALLDGSGAFVSGCTDPVEGAPFNLPYVFADGTFLIPGSTLFQVGPDLFFGNAALVEDGAAGAAAIGFGSGGVMQTPVGGSYDLGNAVALAADGSVLIGGAHVDLGQAAVVRLTPSGTPDPSFGSAGIVDGLAPLSEVYDLAIQSTGAILVGGQAAGSDFVALRLTPSGALDPTFGSGGIVSVAQVGSDVLAQGAALAMGSDDSLYVVGEAFIGTGSDAQLAVMHLTADGVIDPTYGSGGVTLTAAPGLMAGSGMYALVGSDGSVIVAASAASGEVVRFAPGGTVDTSFAGTGALMLGEGSGVTAFGLARQGTAIVAIGAATGSDGLILARFDDTGTLDPSFGVGGSETLPTTDVGGGPYAIGAAVDANGNLLLGNALASPDELNEEAAIVRLLPDGSLDPAWGSNGVQLYPLSGGPSTLHQLAFQPDGKLVAVGRAWTPTGSSDLAALRLVY